MDMDGNGSGVHAAAYGRIWREISAAYEDCAKSLGIPHSNMFALDVIHDNPGVCTQRMICRETLLPKQTVNAIVTGFLRQGLVELVELDSDRRTKIIHLTASGRGLAERIVPRIRDAERRAMAMMGSRRRADLIAHSRRYAGYFRECLRENFPGMSSAPDPAD